MFGFIQEFHDFIFHDSGLRKNMRVINFKPYFIGA